MRSALSACRRRVAPLHGVIPPDWRRRGRGSWWCGRQSADPLGENAETRLFWLNGSALWRMSCLSWCVGRTRTRYCERQPTKIPTFAHQHAKESPPDQHVSSFNPETMLIDKRHKKAAHSGRPFLLSQSCFVPDIGRHFSGCSIESLDLSTRCTSSALIASSKKAPSSTLTVASSASLRRTWEPGKNRATE